MKLCLACCSAAAALGIGGLGAVRSEATPEPDAAVSQAECRVVSAECVGGKCVITCESADGRGCRVELECPGCPACTGEDCEVSCEVACGA